MCMLLFLVKILYNVEVSFFKDIEIGSSEEFL